MPYSFFNITLKWKRRVASLVLLVTANQKEFKHQRQYVIESISLKVLNAFCINDWTLQLSKSFKCVYLFFKIVT